VFIVHDGQSIQSTVFASRIRPKGFRSQSHEQLQDACRQAGIRIEDPPCLVAELYDLEATVEHLGRDAFQVEALPEDGYRATFHMKNAPNVKIELEAFAKDGFHISTYRVLNEGQELPASIKHATWKKVDGHWIITKLTRENRFRGRKHLAYSKAIIGYYSWELNKRIDPSTFTAKSMNPDWKPDPVGE
jgi:hypothetical protein